MRNKVFAALALLSATAFAPAAAAQVSGRFDGANGGAVIIGASTTTCDSSIEGAVRYNGTSDALEYCDGAAWKAMVASSASGDTSTPPAGSGYFVMTAGTWDGNLGNLSGADAKCLTDLTNNDWLNKADASSRGLIDSTHVKAFLCNFSVCNNGMPNTTYVFAVSGKNTIGGATFTTDSSGNGPGNTQNWTGTNYFGTAYSYWVGRGAGSNTAWGAASNQNSWTCSPEWSSALSGSSGSLGISNSTDTSRWRYSNTTGGCNVPQNLICFVHP